MPAHRKSKSSRRWSLNPSVARARAAAHAEGVGTDDGVTLIEVVIALVILLIVTVPMGYLLDSMVAQAATVRQREAALELADQWTEILSNSTPPLNATTGAVQLGVTAAPVDPTGVVSATPTVGGTLYSVTAEYTEQLATGVSDNLCSTAVPSTTNPGVIVVQVTVSWSKGRQSVTDSTNLQYPTPGVPTDGFIAVQVTNSGITDVNGITAASRVQAVPVTITGPSGTQSTTQTLYPDDNGCVFDQVPTGTYTVKVGQPATDSGKAPFPFYSGIPAFVDPSGNTSPAVSPASFTVNVTQEQPVVVTFDEGVNPTVTFASATPVQDGVECPGSSAIACITAGTGTGSAAMASSGGTSTWTSGTVTGATRITGVSCTTAATPTCVGVGNLSTAGGSGVIYSGTGTLSSATLDSIPAGITNLTQVVCPSTDGCYAIGTSTSGTPVLLAGSFSGTPVWQQFTDPAQTFGTLSSIACPSATTCELTGSFKTVSPPATTPAAGILRLDGDPGTHAATAGTLVGPTFTLDTMPSNLTTVGTISCPATTAHICLAIGTGDPTLSTDPVILTTSVSATAGTASTWATEPNFTAQSALTLTGLSCSPTACMAIGTASTGVAAWEADITQSPDDWRSVAGLSTYVTTLTGVACGAPSGSDLGDCALVGSKTGSTSGTMLAASLQGSRGAGIWTSLQTVALPTSLVGQVEYFSGIACEAPAAGSECAAVGAGASGPFVVTTGGGTGSTWSPSTPASFTGAQVSSIPVEVSANTTGWTTEPYSSSTGVLTNTLYPELNGYTIAAGDCKGEANYSDTLGTYTASGVNGAFSGIPGSTPSAVVPLGTLPLDIISPVGSAVSGATVTMTAASNTSGTTCTADAYTLPNSGPEGLSRTAVPFGLYNVTIHGTINSVATIATLEVMVGASSVVTAVTVGTSTTYTSYSLPGPVPVVL